MMTLTCIMRWVWVNNVMQARGTTNTHLRLLSIVRAPSLFKLSAGLCMLYYRLVCLGKLWDDISLSCKLWEDTIRLELKFYRCWREVGDSTTLLHYYYTVLVLQYSTTVLYISVHRPNRLQPWLLVNFSKPTNHKGRDHEDFNVFCLQTIAGGTYVI